MTRKTRTIAAYFLGWFGWWIVSLFGVIRFVAPPVYSPFPDACILLGYPKRMDYFWYFSFPAVAVLFAWFASRWGAQREHHNQAGEDDLLNGPSPKVSPGIALCVCFALATVW